MHSASRDPTTMTALHGEEQGKHDNARPDPIPLLRIALLSFPLSALSPPEDTKGTSASQRAGRAGATTQPLNGGAACWG